MTIPTKRNIAKRNVKIYEYWSDGITITDIAKIYSLSRQQIHSIVNNLVFERSTTIDLTNSK